jgi:hypothetical protein
MYWSRIILNYLNFTLSAWLELLRFQPAKSSLKAEAICSRVVLCMTYFQHNYILLPWISQILFLMNISLKKSLLSKYNKNKIKVTNQIESKIHGDFS